MKERPILVTGGSGFIGGHLASEFSKHYDTYFTYWFHPLLKLAAATGLSLDISDCRATSEVIEEINPRLILHSAALTSFNDCASNPCEAEKINIMGTENIARSAAKIGARIINFSTDMVFNGTGSYYSEIDKPNPCCTYGRTKYVAERVIESTPYLNFLSLRLSLVYGTSLTDAKCHLEEQARMLLKGNSVIAFKDEFRTPVYVKDVVDFVTAVGFRDDVVGVLHLGGPMRMSRYEFAVSVAELLDLPEGMVVPVSSKEVMFQETRPEDCSLSSLNALKWMERQFTQPASGINEMLDDIKEISFVLST